MSSQRRAQASRRRRREVRAQLRCRRDHHASTICAPSTTLCWWPQASTRRVRSLRERRRSSASSPRWIISSPPNRIGLGDDVPAFDRRQAERQGPPRRRHRRRRHRNGLRAHRHAAKAQERHLPLSPRPRQHAGLAARSEHAEEEGVVFDWLAAPKAFPRPARKRPRVSRAHATRRAGRDRAAKQPEENAGQRIRGARRSHHRRARLRPGRFAARLWDAPELKGEPLGHVERSITALTHNRDAGRVRRRRHRARRVARGAGPSAKAATRPTAFTFSQ